MLDGFVTDPFTIADGVLVLDSPKKKGVREIDASAGSVRLGDGGTMPIADLQAVAMLYVEREVWIGGVDDGVKEPRMGYVVALVPRELPPEVSDRLARIARGETAGPAAIPVGAELDPFSFQLLFRLPTQLAPREPSAAIIARTAAKEIARYAQLPLIELHDEQPLFRLPAQLDQPLRERLAAQTTALPDPGPPPAELAVERTSQALSLSWRGAQGSSKQLVLLLGAISLCSGAAAIVVIWPGGLALGVPFVAIGAFCLVGGLRRKSQALPQLVVDQQQIRWLHDGEEESLGVDELELMRLDFSTLRLIVNRGEARCELPSVQAAEWAQRAIERQLRAPAAEPYR